VLKELTADRRAPKEIHDSAGKIKYMSALAMMAVDSVEWRMSIYYREN